MINQELIGKNINIIDAKNKSLIGIQGNILDETRETLIIKTKKGEKRIPKKDCVFKINEKIFPGKEIMGRSEERMKK